MFGRIHRGLIACMVVVIALVVAVPTARSQEVRIAGGGVPVNDILKPLAEPFKQATGTTLVVISEKSAEALLQKLMNKSADAVATSLPSEEFLGGAKAIVKLGKDSLRTTVIAQTPVSVVVGRDNPVSKLSRDQLKGVFAGTIRNWKELGGEDKPIRIIRPWGYPIMSAFRHQVMDAEQYASTMTRSRSWEDARKAVGDAADAITILPATLADQSVKKLETPEILQSDTILTVGDPSPLVQKFIDFARGEGRKRIILNH
ncbi:substrate-binding domain-containing protein [Geobacter hydrogenophilus]|uniref:Phosphate-binding protein n=1 Tax=Geobacter hydrogenophilus TaxID=40983 RepID=A0A9W6G1F5_9BACT|nr:substrate-binding domain-containing protein [Geobacter hydrogenophilus]MBT0894114.1 substrate-binding domain-containing protein [Geobacter hydrogenophilus]GLI38603.1 phosphate-binding protein [Geobacter hydrogenophilus]